MKLCRAGSQLGRFFVLLVLLAFAPLAVLNENRVPSAARFVRVAP